MNKTNPSVAPRRVVRKNSGKTSRPISVNRTQTTSPEGTHRRTRRGGEKNLTQNYVSAPVAAQNTHSRSQKSSSNRRDNTSKITSEYPKDAHKRKRNMRSRQTPKVNGTLRSSGVKLPELKKGTLRMIPIGGCEEVGRNMTIFEYEDDIVILDMGLQFPEEDMLGIDYIIPNIGYLKGKEKNIRGVIFTHGHLDHIGAAPFLLDQLGYPPIIARDLTLALLKHKQQDYKKGSEKNLKIVRVNSLNDTISLGKITATFFQVEHSIMDSMGVVIQTPDGTAIHPGDWTMERDAQGKTNLTYDHLAELPGPTALMLESLGSLSTKRHGTYEEMYHNLRNILEKANGRIIIGTFSSQVERVKWVIYAASKLGKKVALDGYSMKMNVEIAKELGYIKEPKGVMIDIKDIGQYPDNKVVVICTGAQGEDNAVLMRIIRKEHRQIELKKNDTVIFSSSVIPGNERTIQRLKDNIYRQCDNVIHGDIMDVHISGHSTRQDIVEMITQIKPNYYIPVYANHFFLKEARNLAMGEAGMKDEEIVVPDNGTIIDLNRKGLQVHKVKAPSDYVFVDGLGITDMQHVVLRDRQVLAEDGMIVVIATVDTHTGALVQNPDIISRGFIFLKENKQVIEDIRKKVQQLIHLSDPLSWADTDNIKNEVRDKVGQYIFQKTGKRPMVLPVVIQV